MREIVILGGTFDLFHKGHKLFLGFAISLGKKILVGITSDEFAAKKNHDVEPFEQRLKNVSKFLDTNHANFEIFKLEDFAGLSIRLEKGTLISTSDTLKNSILINKIRLEKNLPPLEILLVPLLEAEDSEPISSSRIRKGDINEEGYLKARKA
ncbi:MAG: pantetheine-phosphate adenylyltransferase [Nitrososphaerota archaeon]|nr:pantetheine-phosphate adenylyltransferase [Nitrososphaerota archaeon]